MKKIKNYRSIFILLFFILLTNVNAQKIEEHPKASKAVRKKIVATILGMSGGSITKKELFTAKKLELKSTEKLPGGIWSFEVTVTKNANIKAKDNQVDNYWKTGNDINEGMKAAMAKAKPGYKITFGRILIKTKEEPYCYIDDISFIIKEPQ